LSGRHFDEPRLQYSGRTLVAPSASRTKPHRRVRDPLPLHALPGDPFDALGDPHRRAIVELLRSGDRSVRELADELPISRPAVSRHLKLLKDAGLVTDRAEGTRRLYRLHDEGIEAVQAYLRQVWGDAAARFKLLADN
jgi:DNA-binding transcriptional ArsR family regulator